jgi:O-antigen/teichoic acid export membrane protein
MILTMLVSLYTVRVVLDTLGKVDYGIYNVVGGIVAMFSFLSGTMASASQRFFAFELGQKNFIRLKQIFSLTLSIYIGIAIIILLLAEIFGLWFLNTQMNIPPERINAANWIYQLSIFSFMTTMFTIPYNAVIIARENMKVYAYVSIIEVILKLVAVYLLVLFSYDKLILHAILIFCITTLITFIYRIYCIRKYEECKFSFFKDKTLLKEIIGYSGWNLFGALSSVCKGHGINIVLNLFFNPAINAARGIAYQVDSILLNFGGNFFTAVRPNIIKLYSSNNHDKMMNLIRKSTKFSFYLLLFLSLPLLLETDFIVGLWLTEIPEYTVTFIRLVIIDTLLEFLIHPIVTLVQASGKVKWYQIVIGCIRILNLPIAYFVLYSGFSPSSVFYVMIIITILCNILRLIFIKYLIDFDFRKYFGVVLLIFTITFFTFIIPKCVQLYLNDATMCNSIAVLTITMINSIVFITLFGINGNERIFLYNMLKNKINKYATT